ncbi:helix-turn-helix domain-containing protein [Paenibacillus sp. HB172176]|uniref:helix-turn-helix domain-containing protein n=1 Tax=Paenibacillus sp. HB172176 TaxID=2493690 RepID=UPI00143B8D75|nr:helix-turn-helix domain-containing protein [Paenibacillus sp. HB172176]
MSDLGALLRQAREERGLSLDDIQEVTKIRKRYLEAIETGDYRVLPGTFYVRAFVKNYSEAVGLEPDEVLRLYKHEVPAPNIQQAAEPIPARKPRKMKSQKSEKLGKIGFNVLMWSFLVLIVLVIWYYAINKKSDPPGTADDTPITEQSSEPNATDGTGSPTDDAVVSPTPPPPTAPPTTVVFNSKVGISDQYDIGPAGVAHTVEIKISGKCWVEVRSGGTSGEKLFYANAQEGSVQTYELTDTLYINVGRADFAEIRVDGVLVPDTDKAGKKTMLLQPLKETNTNSQGSESGGSIGSE